MFQVLKHEKLLWGHMDYKDSFFGFANSNWVVKDLQSNNFLIWTANRWHHVCFSFNRQTNRLLLVKDGQKTSVNYVKKNLNLTHLNSEILNHIIVGQSGWQNIMDYSYNFKQISDIHIWDLGLTGAQMESWTSCG